MATPLAPFLALLAQAALAAAGYGVNVAVARFLDVDAYGLFAVVYSLLLTTELVARLGVPSAAARLAAAEDDVRWMEWGFALTFLLGLLAAMVLWLAAALVATLTAQAGMGVLLGVAAFDALAFLPYLCLVTGAPALGRPSAPALITLGYAAARLLLTVLALWLAPSVASALMANALASGCGLLGGWLLLRLRPRLPPPGAMRRLAADASLAWSRVLAFQLMVPLPLWFASGFETGDRAGLFAAALTLARLPLLVPLATAPLILADAASGSRFRTTSLDLSLLMLLPPSVLLAFEAPWIVPLLFGPAYAQAGDLARLLTLGLGLGTGLLQLLSIHAFAAARMREAVGLPWLAFALALVLFAPVTWFAGAEGLAAATLLVPLLPALAAWLRVQGAAVVAPALATCAPLSVAWFLAALGTAAPVRLGIAGAIWAVALAWTFRRRG